MCKWSTDYSSLLKLSNGVTLLDPLNIKQGWVGEETGMSLWPPTMYSDMAEYLTDTKETSLKRRLMGDYKDGKSYSYFTAGFIEDIYYHDIDQASEVCLIKTRSSRSQKKDEAHRVWVALHKLKGTILSAYCSCFAGLGATCNHVAGALFKLDWAWQKGISKKSCTSLPSVWDKPSTKKGAIAATKIKDLKFDKPLYMSTKKKKTRPATKTRNKYHGNGSPTLEQLMSALYITCQDSCVFQYANPSPAITFAPDDDLNVSSHTTITTSCQVPLPLSCLIDSHSIPVFTKEQVGALIDATKKQSDSSTWKEQRIGRITASIAKSVVIGARKIANDGVFSNSLLNRIMGKANTPDDIKSLKYGKNTEESARVGYTRYMKSSHNNKLYVAETGLHVIKDKIYVGASPDGIVFCPCCTPSRGLLEIKCPISISHTTPQESPPPYLTVRDGALKLVDRHEYFYQMQLQMLATDTAWCDFFVYTAHGHHIERILANHDVQMEIVQAADVVFFEKVLPELQAQRGEIVQDKGSTCSGMEPPPHKIMRLSEQ